jgi:hypothetical protein
MKCASVLLTAFCIISAASSAEVGLRVRLGLTDKEPAKWDGTISLDSGRVTQITGWRFANGDAVQDTKGWNCSTRHQPLPAARKLAQRAGKRGNAPQAGPMMDNGVVVTLADATDESRVEIKTAQGGFSFRLGDVAFGKPLTELKGAASVERIVPATPLTTARTDDDYPAAAVAPDGTIYVACVSFTPGLDRDARSRALDGPIKDFAPLAKPAGGDQVWLRALSGGHWGEPVAVTPGKGDIFRCAVAVDGSGRAWVFWSENKDANFDIWARSFKDGRGSEPQRLTTDAGPDVAPVAVTDANGRVWVAWQGARQNVFRILARHQTEGGWSEETVVGSQSRNCWDPAIAASTAIEGKGGGRVAIAWDSYDKGDYDVWLSEFDAGGKPTAPRPAAATLRFEARPSLAYDKGGRLWVAWEEGAEMWAKDFGALAKKGVPIYQSGRSINLRVLEDGHWKEPLDPVADALPGPARAGRGKRAKAAPAGGEAVFNNFARLAADRDGRVWLLCRTRGTGNRATPVGSAWLSEAACYDGKQWVGPIPLANSDNLGDNRPAVVAAPEGGVFMAWSTDHRMARRVQRAAGAGNASLGSQHDPFDNDIMVGRVALASPPGATELKTADAPSVAKPSADEIKEAADVARIRDYRTRVGGNELRILRGEFHRHTEISGDGMGDGPLEDMWRYAIDSASMDWIGNGDHDNGGGREYPWWIIQKSTDAYRLPGLFEPMFTYERSVQYPEGHRNVVFAKRGIRTLPRLPKQNETDPGPAPDTEMLYRYLHYFDGVCASHTSATQMGTDWRNNDPQVEPVVEIYQGDRQSYEKPGAPRSPKEGDSIGGWRPKGFVNLALQKGYRFGFEASSDHISTHISYCCVFATATSRDAVLAGLKARRVYGATDNIIADVRCPAGGREHFMGEEFETAAPPTLKVKLIGTAPFARVVIIKDNEYVHTVEPKTAEVEFSWTDAQPSAGKTCYYYVRGEQADGELVWVSPMWIKYQP